MHTRGGYVVLEHSDVLLCNSAINHLAALGYSNEAEVVTFLLKHAKRV